MKTTLENGCSCHTLARTHAFWGLEPAELLLVSQIVSEETMSPGDVLIREGEPESCLLILTEGMVRVMGRNGVVTELGDGAVVGEVALFDQRPRTADVVATSYGRYLRIPSLDLWFMLDKHPELGMKVLNNLGRVMAARIRSATM